jgi:beta-lactamase class A
MSPQNLYLSFTGNRNQRLNGKIPFFIHGKAPIAHKTGEDDGITHDVAIVYAIQPFILCLCGNEVEVPQFERIMQDISAELMEMQS